MRMEIVKLVLLSLTCVVGTAGAIPAERLRLDLDAARGVQQDAEGRVLCWTNQVADSAARDFVPNDIGREVPGSGVPSYRSADDECCNIHEAACILQDAGGGMCYDMHIIPPKYHSPIVIVLISGNFNAWQQSLMRGRNL